MSQLANITSIDEYLIHYGPHLARRADDLLRPVHQPGKDPLAPAIATFLRTPFEPQAHLITAVAKAMKHQKSIFIVGEMGTGKTLMGQCAAHAHAAGKPYRALTFCPGHLPRKWKREIEQTIPGAKVRLIERCGDLLDLDPTVPPSAPEWFVIARDRAKLGAKWRPLALDAEGRMRCPKCGAIQKEPKSGGVLPPDYFLGKVKKRKGKSESEDLEVEDDTEDRNAPVKRFCNQLLFDAEGRITLDERGQIRTCGERLWTYTHKMKRFEPAKYIHKKLRGYFDYLVIDEVHEEKGATTAQANAVGSLAASSKRVIALTGTLLGGYADHLRPLLFRLTPRTIVSEGFEWSKPMPFSERYGRIETKVTIRDGDGDSKSSHRQSRGKSQQTRKSVRPGIMPTLFGAHLLHCSAFLALDEVAANLPTLDEQVVPVPMDPEMAAAYERMEKDLAQAIRDLMTSRGPGGAAKLLGTMLNCLLLYPDYPSGWELIGYTDDDGFRPVTRPANLSMLKPRAKEQALLDAVMREYYLGRQSWVFCEYNGQRNVQGRLAELLRKKGLRVAELHSSVKLENREDWIARHGKNHDVILSHPRLVETGLDLFDKGGAHNFSTLFFYETGYNLFTVRQASRRSWRIGQKLKCKVRYFYYEKTVQERAIGLMGRKMAAAQAIDGKFSAEGLAAMGGDDSIELAMAKALADSLPENAARDWEKIGGNDEPVILSLDEAREQQEMSDLLAMLDASGL